MCLIVDYIQLKRKLVICNLGKNKMVKLNNREKKRKKLGVSYLWDEKSFYGIGELKVRIERNGQKKILVENFLKLIKDVKL